jgi:hypothetical protein
MWSLLCTFAHVLPMLLSSGVMGHGVSHVVDHGMGRRVLGMCPQFPAKKQRHLSHVTHSVPRNVCVCCSVPGKAWSAPHAAAVPLAHPHLPGRRRRLAALRQPGLVLHPACRGHHDVNDVANPSMTSTTWPCSAHLDVVLRMWADSITAMTLMTGPIGMFRTT